MVFMNQTLYSASPRPILTGVDDMSTAQPTYEMLEDSQHLPLFLLRTEKGPEEILITDISRATQIYGSQSFESTSVFHTHQTQALLAAARGGNATVAIKRILGTNPQKAKLTIQVETTTEEVDVSSKIVVKQAADLKNKQYTPLISFEALSYGTDANKLCINIVPGDATVQMLNKTQYNGFVYEFRLMRHDSVTNRYTPIYTAYNDIRCLFTLNPDTRSGEANPYYLPNVIKEMYGNEDIPEASLLNTVEVDLEALSNLHLYLNGLKLTNQSTYTEYDILGVGGLTVSPLLNYKFDGGSDGYLESNSDFVSNRVANLEIYDDGVRQFFESLDDNSPLGDLAKYPISTFYDTGFSMKTKMKIRNLIALRQDIWVGLSAFMVANHFKDIDGTEGFTYHYGDTQESAIAVSSALRAAFFLQPESLIYGTSTMNCIVVMQSGIYTASGFKERQSIIIDLIEKISRYIGAQDGVWKMQYAFDQSPINELRGWANVDFTYRSKSVQETCWDTGITWVQNKSTSTLFYPAYQTIYPDDSSTLNNIFTMMACCYLKKVVYRVWAQVSGNGRDPDTILADKVNVLIDREVSGKFDNRFTIQPNTYFTHLDNERGYSWTTDITIYSNVTKTVGVYKITTHRMS